MDASKEARLKALTEEIAALLYEETEPEAVTTLAGIETAVRGHLLEHVGPQIGNFYPHEQRHDAWTASSHCQHHRSGEHQ
jgi:hypothetical protein